MNTLIIGDIHCKSKFILPRIDQAIDAYGVNKVVFVGDYFDEWGASDNTIYEAIDQLIEWKIVQEKNGLETIFLVGNHDYAYLNPISSACSGHHEEVTNFARRRLNEYLDVQLSCPVNSFLITHGGLSAGWARLALGNIKNDSVVEISNKLNSLFKGAQGIANDIINGTMSVKDAVHMHKNPLMLIEYCSYYRGGTNKYAGPLWCDMRELEFVHVPGLNQIVGHTPVDTCTMAKVADSNEETTFWFVDTCSLMSNGDPIGDGSFLLVGDSGTDVIGTIHDDNLTEYKPSVTAFL